MSWIHVAIATGYVVVLITAMALLHGAMLVYRDLCERRQAELEQQQQDEQAPAGAKHSVA